MKGRIAVLLFFSAFFLAVSFTGRALPAEQKAVYSRSIENCTIPDVTLVNQDGKKVRLREFLPSAKRVIIDFIYSTCTTICPVESANFKNFQERLGPEAAKVQLLSISIDPEHDTPKAMKEYLKRFYAKEGWTYLTGSRPQINQVLRAFNASEFSDKMENAPRVMMRIPLTDSWIRIDGFIGASTLVEEHRKIKER